MNEKEWKEINGEQRQLPQTDAEVEMPKVEPAKDSNQPQDNSEQ